MPSGEAAQLIGRTGTDLSTGVKYPGGGNDTWVAIADQKLWAISYNEWNGLSADMKKYGSDYWLRSPLGLSGSVALVGRSGRGDDYYGVHITHAVRPASDLNLSSVIFTSTNDVANGKGQAATGGAWYNYTPAQPARDIKFTFLDTLTDL